jgi:SSS family solute:Na+ symporter
MKDRFVLQAGEEKQMKILKSATWIWGILGTGFALWMIQAKSTLDVWWQISGIFGGGILGLFIIALSNLKLSFSQGLTAIGISVGVIIWSTFARNISGSFSWLNCTLDPILSGVLGTVCLLIFAGVTHLLNKKA